MAAVCRLRKFAPTRDIHEMFSPPVANRTAFLVKVQVEPNLLWYSLNTLIYQRLFEKGERHEEIRGSFEQSALRIVDARGESHWFLPSGTPGHRCDRRISEAIIVCEDALDFS